MSNEEQSNWRQKVHKKVARSLSIARRGSVYDEIFVALWIILEWIIDGKLIRIFAQDVPIYLTAISEVLVVNLADVELLQDVIDLGLLMNGEELPVCVDATPAGSQNYLPARMLLDEVCDVVYASLADDPLAVGVSVVFDHFGKSDLVIVW